MILDLATDRFWGEPSPTDLRIVADMLGPVLDVGCGPGRIAGVLAQHSVPVLGIDVAPTAVHEASGRGAPVLCASVFDRRIPAGTWATVLLLDGNVGIGGDPAALLDRVRELMQRSGRAVVEVGLPGSTTTRVTARLPGAAPPIPWATVSADHIPGLAAGAGLTVARTWSDDGRWFSALECP